MALATLPPSTEIVDTFRPGSKHERIGLRNILSDTYWVSCGAFEQPAWRSTAFWKISELRTSGKLVHGLGDMRPSDRASSEIRKLLSTVEIQSLPLPTVSPISGGGLSVSWKNGTKAVEASAYSDGEILVEGLENQELNEEASSRDLEEVLRWLVES